MDEETLKAKANTQLSILVYNANGCSGPITAEQKKKWLTQQGYASYQDYVDYFVQYYTHND